MNQQVNNNQSVLPRRSRRLATNLPASHWIGLGYSEDDAQSMEELQNDMKKYCDNSGDADIILRGRGEGTPLPYHDMILPHWKKLAKALKGRTNVEFLITGISLPISVLDVMFPAVQMMNLQTLQLLGVDMGNTGLLRLAAFLGDSSLSGIALGWDAIDESVAKPLADALKNHPTLERIGFARCELHNVAVLKMILEGCKTMKLLAICMEDLKSDSIDVLADFISSNHLLRSINLCDNNIKDSDAAQLATALKNNTNMHGLHLYDNDITEDGESCLRKVLFDPTSIDTIVQSNHRCRVYTYNNDDRDNSIIAHRPPLEKEILRINKEEYTIGQKIRKKIVLALCGPNRELFDLAFLNGLPLQLMPRMLELIQEYGRTKTEAFRFMLPDGREDEVLEAIDRYIGPWPSSKELEKDALSRLYHTLRGWELPSLFVNLNNAPANVSTGKRKRRKTRRY